MKRYRMSKSNNAKKICHRNTLIGKVLKRTNEKRKQLKNRNNFGFGVTSSILYYDHFPMTTPKPGTEAKIETLRHCVEQGPKPQAIACLKKALKERSNFLIAKAAEFAAEQLAYELIPDLRASYDRFLVNGITTDKTCAAKRALIRALYDLDYADAAFYRQNLGYRQLEPVYGGHADTAIDLRCTCALGLVASNDPTAILSLLELLHDTEHQARLGALRAVELALPFHAEIVLRHKILQGDAEPEIITQCFSSLMKVAPEESLPFIAAYLDCEDGLLREGAALALGESRLDEALALLIQASDALEPFDPLMQSFHHAIALQRKDSAYRYLLDKLAKGSLDEARYAAMALSMYSYNQDLKGQVTAIVRDRNSQRLDLVLESHWND